VQVIGAFGPYKAAVQAAKRAAKERAQGSKELDDVTPDTAAIASATADAATVDAAVPDAASVEPATTISSAALNHGAVRKSVVAEPLQAQANTTLAVRPYLKHPLTTPPHYNSLASLVRSSDEADLAILRNALIRGTSANPLQAQANTTLASRPFYTPLHNPPHHSALHTFPHRH